MSGLTAPTDGLSEAGSAGPPRSRSLVVRALTTLALVAGLVIGPVAVASAEPPRALPENASEGDLKWQPALDYDTDSCYPTPAIGPDGTPAEGLPAEGDPRGGCRDLSDLENTNAYVRTWCTLGWCAHKYALYFEKDQTRGGEIAGHRNDLEHIIVWVKDDVVRYVATSAHGDYTVRSAKAVRFDDTHPKIVYHKDGLTTHAFRFATGGDEPPENDRHTWQRPALVGWERMDPKVRETFATHDYGSATLALNDENYEDDLVKAIPYDVDSADWHFDFDAPLPPTDSPAPPPPPEPPAPPEPPVGDRDAVLRLMPLGSSSTAGDGSSTGNGYRDYLRTKAFKAGRPDDLVGSNVAGTMSDRDNEGWPGFEIDLIAGKAKCAVRTYQPNVITVLAGANDVNNNHDGAPARLEALIRQVISDDAGVTVLVGGIQPLITSPAATLRAATYNTAQRDLVSKLAAEGLKVGWAPNDVTTGDIREDDKIHPGDRGYEKIATGYATALATARDKLWLTAPNPQAADVGSHPCGSQDWGNGDGNGGNGTGGNQGVVDRRWEDHGVSFAAGFGKGNAYRWGDVNKDGKPELFVVRPDQSWTFYWNGGRTDKGWTGWAKGVSRPAATRGLVGNRLRIADIDGDGEPDCLQVGSDGLVDAYLWDASKPVGQKLCGKASKQQHDVPKTGAIAADTQIVFADVNGDGRDDYLLVQPRGTTRLWLNGQKPDPKKAGTSVFAWTPVGQITGALPDPRVRRWADVNGDGRADQILLTAKGGARAWINDGLTKDTSGRVTGVRLRDIGEIAKDKNVPPNDVQFVDVGGNGRADFVRVGWTGVTHIWLNRLNADDLR